MKKLLIILFLLHNITIINCFKILMGICDVCIVVVYIFKIIHGQAFRHSDFFSGI